MTIISVLRTSRIVEQVDHRELILPQLCATGVERRKITEVTGWSTRWGPARLEDLPQFLRRGRHVVKRERFMRFPLWERMEMAFMWGRSTPADCRILSWAIGSWEMGLCALAVILFVVGGLFGALPWLKVTGKERWFTFGAFAVLGFVIGLGVLFVLGSANGAHLWLAGATAVGTIGVLSIDLAGTTPWYGSYINQFHNEAHIDLVESAAPAQPNACRCARATSCR